MFRQVLLVEQVLDRLLVQRLIVAFKDVNALLAQPSLDATDVGGGLHCAIGQLFQRLVQRSLGNLGHLDGLSGKRGVDAHAPVVNQFGVRPHRLVFAKVAQLLIQQSLNFYVGGAVLGEARHAGLVFPPSAGA